jgi:hypothetical protein
MMTAMSASHALAAPDAMPTTRGLNVHFAPGPTKALP